MVTGGLERRPSTPGSERLSVPSDDRGSVTRLTPATTFQGSDGRRFVLGKFTAALSREDSVEEWAKRQLRPSHQGGAAQPRSPDVRTHWCDPPPDPSGRQCPMPVGPEQPHRRVWTESFRLRERVASEVQCAAEDRRADHAADAGASLARHIFRFQGRADWITLARAANVCCCVPRP
jgi:hypothetical protein